VDVQPRRILWPTDFSDFSLRGGRYAAGFARQFDAELHVIHVVAPAVLPDLSVMAPAGLPVPTSEPDLLDTCNEHLTQLIQRHFPQQPHIVRKALLGHPWSEICDYAEEADIDLIVLTTHGRTGIEHVLIGSTAERVVQHAPCPVLTIKHDCRDFLVGGPDSSTE
jgi:nucleotide-binding universal stress UspA family protein